MQAFPADLDVLEQSCRAFINICSNGKVVFLAPFLPVDFHLFFFFLLSSFFFHFFSLLFYFFVEKNRKSIAKDGGLDVILECLKVGLASAHLLAAACWCIRNLSVEGLFLSSLPSLFFLLFSLLTLVSLFPFSSFPFSFFLFLFLFPDATKKMICQKSGIELVVKAMQAHPTHLALQTQGSWAIENVSLKSQHLLSPFAFQLF